MENDLNIRKPSFYFQNNCTLTDEEKLVNLLCQVLNPDSEDTSEILQKIMLCYEYSNALDVPTETFNVVKNAYVSTYKMARYAIFRLGEDLEETFKTHTLPIPPTEIYIIGHYALQEAQSILPESTRRYIDMELKRILCISPVTEKRLTKGINIHNDLLLNFLKWRQRKL